VAVGADQQELLSLALKNARETHDPALEAVAIDLGRLQLETKPKQLPPVYEEAIASEMRVGKIRKFSEFEERTIVASLGGPVRLESIIDLGRIRGILKDFTKYRARSQATA
jgi:hypothetical protein